jgi:hypothetical protein
LEKSLKKREKLTRLLLLPKKTFYCQKRKQESVDMPVLFYVDPEIDDDPRLAGIDTVTLSYTFFLVDDGKSAAGGEAEGGEKGEEAKGASSAAAAAAAATAG